jgi:hypothetical protein
VIAAVVGLVAAALPAGAVHDGFDRHSHGIESSRGDYRGVAVTRWDNTMRGIPNDGCTISRPFDGHPMYQTQWVIVGDDDWIELGTGHQCNDTFRYWFWGYGFNGGWFPRGTRGIPGTQKHTFRTWRDGATAWRYEIDVTRMATLEWNVQGVRVEAGLESYAQNGTTENQGQPGTQNYESLQHRSALGNWLSWAGRDGQVENAPLCGSWLNDITWRTGANVGDC